jgi:hypothetical protein
MPTRILVAAALLALGALAQTPRLDPNRPDPNKPNTNYDESKVGSYTLPDPLVLANGERVRDVKTWVEKRRPEIFRVIESEFFGRSPERPKDLHWEVTETGRAYDGKAIRKQVTIYFSAKKDGPRESVLIYLPADAKGPVPLFLAINFTGNQHVSADPAIELPLVWNRERTQRDDREPERQQDVWRCPATVGRLDEAVHERHQPDDRQHRTERVELEPFINVEEKIDRIVGRRTKAPNGLSTATSCKAESIACVVLGALILVACLAAAQALSNGYRAAAMGCSGPFSSPRES